MGTYDLNFGIQGLRSKFLRGRACFGAYPQREFTKRGVAVAGFGVHLTAVRCGQNVLFLPPNGLKYELTEKNYMTLNCTTDYSLVNTAGLFSSFYFGEH